jgi:hypothetical protein
MFLVILCWDTIRVFVKYRRDAIHAEKGFQDAIREQRNILFYVNFLPHLPLFLPVIIKAPFDWKYNTLIIH